MNQERVYTETPTPEKQGTTINANKYQTIERAIIDALQEEGEILFRDLPESVAQKLNGSFDGSIAWYTTTVKLDMEVRKIVERVPGSRPQRLRLQESYKAG